MNLYNATPLAAGYTLGLQKSGRNCLVVVAKATYSLPQKKGEKPTLLDEQIQPFETDTYTGEPGKSAPIYENDYATHKPRCDVILHGSAYAIDDKPVKERLVSMQLGKLNKQFRVVGPRKWEVGVVDKSRSKTQPFKQQVISYDTAYGGSDPDPVKKDKELTYKTLVTNPIGYGYYPNQAGFDIDEKPLPLTEEEHRPIRSASKKSYVPQSFGPVARNWYPRHTLGGTYDDHWNDNVKPFLPDDFDELYYQCAPKDQQTDHLKGGETVTLIGLTPQNRTDFQIPLYNVPMQAILSNGDRHNLVPVIDTLTIEPDKKQFMVVWRSRIGLKRSVHEVDTLIVGKPTAGWERARMMDKLYLPLEQLNAFKQRIKKQRAEEERLKQQAEATRAIQERKAGKTQSPEGDST